MIFISSWPGATFCPTSTVRSLTMPFTGATIFVYCRFSAAWSRSAFLRCASASADVALARVICICLGAVLAVARVGLRLNQFALGLRDLLLGCVGAGARGFDGGRTCLGGGGGLVVLLLRNLLLVDQLLVAAKIVLRLHVVGFGFLQLSLGGFELLFRDLNARASAVHVRFGRGNLAAGVDGGDRNGHSGRDRGCLSIFKIGLGAFVGDLIVGGIDLDQHRSCLHVLIVLNVEFDDVAGDAGADRN